MEWWFLEKMQEQNVSHWAHPRVSVLTPESFPGWEGTDDVIQEGDLLHIDFGMTAMGMNTDTQHMAYVLRSSAGEVIGGIVLGWVNVFHQRSDVVVTLLFESQANKGLADTFRGVVDQMVGSLAGYLASRVKAGELRADLPTRTSATMFFSSLVRTLISNGCTKTAAAEAALPSNRADISTLGNRCLQTDKMSFPKPNRCSQRNESRLISGSMQDRAMTMLGNCVMAGDA